MTWWKKNKDAVVKQQAQAESALALSQMQQERIDSLSPELEGKMGTLARLNRENHFAPRLELAYWQRFSKEER